MQYCSISNEINKEQQQQQKQQQNIIEQTTKTIR